jgi:predicted transcriptional regulator
LYDLLAILKQDVSSESALASSAQLSHNIVSQMLAFMLAQGYIKTVKDDSEYKITVLGSYFLDDFKGMRKFLS